MIWLVLLIFAGFILQVQEISEHLPERISAETNFSNSINSYISVMVGILINFAGLYIKRKTENHYNKSHFT